MPETVQLAYGQKLSQQVVSLLAHVETFASTRQHHDAKISA
jgi:hypothetical protein